MKTILQTLFGWIFNNETTKKEREYLELED